jgi:hypothetical protein
MCVQYALIIDAQLYVRVTLILGENHDQPNLGNSHASLGGGVLRWSLVLFFVGFGLYKLTPQEAAGVAPLMAHSHVLFWVNPLLGLRGGSDLIGVVEISLGRASPPNLARAYRAFPLLGAAIGAAELWPNHNFSAFRSWVAFPTWRD